MKFTFLSTVVATFLCGNEVLYAYNVCNTKVTRIGGGTTIPHPNNHEDENTKLADGNIKIIKVSINGQKDFGHSCTITPGSHVDLKVKIENKGDAVYEDAQVYVYVTSHKNADLAGKKPTKKDRNEVKDLAPGESRWISLKNLTIPTNPGKYYIHTWIKSQKYSLDNNHENDYSNTSDKEEFAKVNVEPLPKPNLNIINVRFRERAYPYVYPKIKFDVKNSINHSKHIGNCKVLVQIFQGSTLKFHSTYFYNLDSLNGANKSITKYLTLKSGNLSAGKYDLRITIDPENVVSESNENDNVTNHSFVVFPTLKADLITNAVSFSRANENSPFKVYYNVVNNGNARVTNKVCTLIRVFRSGQEKFWKKQCFDNDISANGGTVNKVADVIGLPAGSGYIMKLNVNYGGDYIEESNYSNNKTNQVFSVFMSTRPDLIVSNAYATHKYHVGRPSKFKYYIKNIGNKDFRGSFWVVTTIKGYRADNQVDNRLFWHQEYITLKTNETRAFTFDLGKLHYGGHKISVKVDNNNQVAELNENNNVRVLNVGVFH